MLAFAAFILPDAADRSPTPLGVQTEKTVYNNLMGPVPMAS